MITFIKKDTCNMKTYEHFSCSVAGQYLNREDSVIFFSTPLSKPSPVGIPKEESYIFGYKQCSQVEI